MVDKATVRRAVSLALVLTGLVTGITGIWNFFPPFNAEFSPGHAVGACSFGVLGVIHVWLNWNPIIRYFKNLGRWWLLVGVGFVGVALLVIIPIIRISR